MQPLFDDSLGAADDIQMRFYLDGREMGEEMDVMKVLSETELTAGDLEMVEACPTEAIIRSWKQLRRVPEKPTASKHYPLMVRRVASILPGGDT
jgi:hypothetical protein